MYLYPHILFLQQRKEKGEDQIRPYSAKKEPRTTTLQTHLLSKTQTKADQVKSNNKTQCAVAIQSYKKIFFACAFVWNLITCVSWISPFPNDARKKFGYWKTYPSQPRIDWRRKTQTVRGNSRKGDTKKGRRIVHARTRLREMPAKNLHEALFVEKRQPGPQSSPSPAENKCYDVIF